MATFNRSLANEYTASYIGTIFSGDIRFSVTGRDNPTDTYILIQALDGYDAYLNAIVSQTIAKGYTQRNVYDAVMRTLEPYGITGGRTPAFSSFVSPRGITLFGRSRDVLDDIASQCGTSWQFVDGKVEMPGKNEAVHEAVVLNSETGLVGMPQQTIGAGVNVRCLINPNIRLNGLIKLDQGSVYRASLSNSDIQMSGGPLGEQTDANGNIYVDGVPRPPASIATDGVYIVRGIMYKGDTRGNDWFMDMMCEARGAADLLSTTAQERECINET